MNRPDAWLLIGLLSMWTLGGIAGELRRIREHLERRAEQDRDRL